MPSWGSLLNTSFILDKTELRVIDLVPVTNFIITEPITVYQYLDLSEDGGYNIRIVVSANPSLTVKDILHKPLEQIPGFTIPQLAIATHSQRIPYFDEKPPKKWPLADAFIYYLKRNPDANRRTILRLIKADLRKETDVKAAALLKNWEKEVRDIPEAKGTDDASPEQHVAEESTRGELAIKHMDERRFANRSSIQDQSTEHASSSDANTGEGPSEAFYRHEQELSDFDNLSDGDSEPEPTSSLTEDYHPNRKTTYDIVSEESGTPHTLVELGSWIIEDYDVLASLHAYRMNSFNIDPKSLNDTRVLAINNIFLFGKNAKDCAIEHMKVYDEDDHGQRGKRIMGTLQGSCEDYIGIPTITAAILRIAAVSKDQSELVAANILHGVGVKFASCKGIDLRLKGSYAHGIVAILLESIFQSEPLLSYQWANGRLGGKRKIADSCFKPDFVVYVTQSSNRYDVGVVGLCYHDFLIQIFILLL
ncbi:hypothetical protein BJV82DRAFT_671789 [Fennellomyces sp. T-0311]|nr:hypothetical protein BJV82DRAFT_671789 [Fennellomyces sp. T-0311]